MLRVRLLGGASIEGDDGPLTGASVQRHRLALLAILCERHPAAIGREALIGLLWPEKESNAARNLLNQAVHALRRALGRSAILSVGPGLRLDASGWSCDLIDFARALDGGEPGGAVESYGGPFLEGLRLTDAPEFERWAERRRAALARALRAAMEELAERARSRGDARTAVDWWRRLQSADPADREVVLGLMTSLAEAGRRAEAVDVASSHARHMEGLGLVPAPEVADLADRLRRSALPRAGRSAPDDVGTRSMDVPPMVGRVDEMAAAHDAWRDSAFGPRLLLVSGEPGIGKSRLADELASWASRQGVVTAATRSFAAEGRLPYAPVAEWLASDALRSGLESLDVANLAEVARLLPELRSEHKDLREPPSMTESWRRQAFFAALAMGVLAVGSPLLLVLDDAQWTDADTLEWLHYLLRYDTRARVLVVVTARMEEVPAAHPLRALIGQLQQDGQLRRIELGPLGAEDGAALACRMTGTELGEAQAAELHRRSEGHPLFIVEMVRAGEVPRFGSTEGRLPVPPRVQAVVRGRLDRLSPGARTLAEVASVIGRSFTVGVLSRAAGIEGHAFDEALDELWQQGIVRASGPVRCDFSHDRIREVAHDAVAPARRRRLHAAVADALERAHTSDPGSVRARLARHYRMAGDAPRSARAFRDSAFAAQALCAHEEAISDFLGGLGVLPELDDRAERDRLELDLQWGLAVSRIARHGWSAPDVAHALERARVLSEAADDVRRTTDVLWAIHAFHLVRSELDRSQDIGERLLELGDRRDDRVARLTGRHSLAFTAKMKGRFVDADEHLRLGGLGDEGGELDTELDIVREEILVLSPALMAHVAWFLGRPEDARTHLARAWTVARERSNPYGIAMAYAYSALLDQLRRDADGVAAHAAATIEVCEEHGFPYYRAWAEMLAGWADACHGRASEGVERIVRGLDLQSDTRAMLRRPYYLCLLAESLRRAGHPARAASVLEEAHATARRLKERWCVPMLLLEEARQASLEERSERAVERARAALETARAQEALSMVARAEEVLAELGA